MTRRELRQRLRAQPTFSLWAWVRRHGGNVSTQLQGGNVSRGGRRRVTLGADPNTAALQSQVDQAMLLQAKASQFPDAPDVLRWLTDSYLLLLDAQNKAIKMGADTFGEVTGELVDRTEQAINDVGGATNKQLGNLMDATNKLGEPLFNNLKWVGIALIVGTVIIGSGGGAQAGLAALASRRVTL